MPQINRLSTTGEQFTNISESFINLSESFVNVRESFVNIGESFVNVRERFVNTSESFVNTSESFVNVGESFVSVDESFVNVKKDFCAAMNQSLTYPLGDANNYSPLIASNVNGTDSLTAAVTDDFLPRVFPRAILVSRYWSLTGAGITTDLTFNYADADLNGIETAYQIYRRTNSSINEPLPTTTINPAANIATVRQIANFLDWKIGSSPLAPTAAQVSVSGRVITPPELGLTNATVTLTDSNGESQTVPRQFSRRVPLYERVGGRNIHSDGLLQTLHFRAAGCHG